MLGLDYDQPRSFSDLLGLPQPKLSELRDVEFGAENDAIELIASQGIECQASIDATLPPSNGRNGYPAMDRYTEGYSWKFDSGNDWNLVFSKSKER